MLDALFTWVLEVTQGLGYFGIVILMAVESSFLPLPSEVVIPPAAYLASQGKMDLWLIAIAGTVGSILGATVNYLLSSWLGRPVIYRLAASRFARFLLINPEKVARAEKYFLTSARSATFYGRLIPVVRHLISIPAGFSRMPYGQFVLFTALGSFLWVSILAALGYFVGENQALLASYYHELTWALLIFGALFIGRRLYRQRRKKKAANIDIITPEK